MVSWCFLLSAQGRIKPRHAEPCVICTPSPSLPTTLLFHCYVKTIVESFLQHFRQWLQGGLQQCKSPWQTGNTDDSAACHRGGRRQRQKAQGALPLRTWLPLASSQESGVSPSLRTHAHPSFAFGQPPHTLQTFLESTDAGAIDHRIATDTFGITEVLR